MRATSGDPGITFPNEVPASPPERSRRAAEPFAGLPMAQAALRFARARHAGQRREIDHAPFIDHPIEVAWLLRRDGQPDEVIAAGLLHDVLEKTATTSAELRRRFGAGSRASSSQSQTIHRSATMSPASATCATGSRRQTPTRTRSSPRTRSPKSGSWRGCQRGNSPNERPARRSPITVPASRCSTEPQVSSPWSISSTPSSSD